MRQKNTTVLKIAQTALLAALCYVSFTFLQIKIPMPGGDATSEMHSVFLARCLSAECTEDWQEQSVCQLQTSWIRYTLP